MGIKTYNPYTPSRRQMTGSDSVSYTHLDVYKRQPLMHRALGTEEQGAVRFSFSHFNTEEEIETAIAAVRELAEDEE